MLKRRIGALVAVVVGVVLVGAPAALAVTPITCSGLSTAVSSATAGEVLQLPAGVCNADLSISNTAAFTLEGASGGGTVLDPTAIGNSIITSGSAVTFTLSGLTLSGTSHAQAVSLTSNGEAVTIEHNTFDDDSVAPSGFGGAISIQIPSSSTQTQPTLIEDNTFNNDSASGGGAVTVLGAVPLVLSGNTFTGDIATGSGGGALNIGAPQGSTTAIQITGNQFGGFASGEGNTATNDGGAIYLQAAHAQPVTLASNTFERNAITGSHTAVTDRQGGAVFMSIELEDTPFTVTQSHNVFYDNTIDATQATPAPALAANGGAEWLIGVDVNSIDEVFAGNRIAVDDGSPPEGGALGAFAAPAAGPLPAEPAAFTGTNDVFRDNSTAAAGWGGAIYVGAPPIDCTGVCPGSTLTLNDSTVVSNKVDAGTGSEGGAIWGSPHDFLTLRNSIVYGNTPEPELWGFGTTSPVIAYSDACSEPGGTAVPAHDGDICVDPLLNLGGEETGSSPTRDAGSVALIPAGVTTDFAGKTRTVPPACGRGPNTVDMGAYEFHPPVAFVPPGAACPAMVAVRVRIAPGRLHDKRGRVSVRIKCVSAVQYCTGTLTLTLTRRKHGSRALGKHGFKVKLGRSATIKVKLARGLGTHGSVGVVVTVRAHDAVRTAGSARRRATLVL